MTIGILETGRPPRALRAEWGTYVDMVRTLLGPGRRYRSYDVRHGEWPEAPDACAAYVVTGSVAGVYDPLPWIAPLMSFLRAARGRAKLAGICFGHQAMAQAFGGAVIKSPKGWGLGLREYDVVAAPPWMDPAPSIAIPAFHQDQVVVPPAGARVLARSAFTPYAMLDYGGGAVSIQPHPEFNRPFARALIEAEREIYGAAAEPALATLVQPDDCAAVGTWLQRFIEGETQAS